MPGVKRNNATNVSEILELVINSVHKRKQLKVGFEDTLNCFSFIPRCNALLGGT